MIHLIEHIISNTAEDCVFLHYDRNSSEEEFLKIKDHFKENSRVFCYQKFSTGWGSIGIVEAEFFLGREIHRLKISSDFIVNLSGLCFPTQSLSHFKKILKNNPGKTFISAAAPGDSLEGLFISEEEYEVQKPPYPTYQSFYPTPTKKYKYLNPKLSWRNIERILIHFAPYWYWLEKNKWKEKAFDYFFKLYSFFTGVMPLPLGIPHRAGVAKWPHNIHRASMHCVISSPLHEKIVISPQAQLWFKLLNNSWAPDELFFPTLIHLFEDKKNIVNKGFGLITLGNISKEIIPSLGQETERYFARKFTSVDLQKEMENIILEKTKSHSSAADKETGF